jgi:two-component system CheB/CheR fusion protein
MNLTWSFSGGIRMNEHTSRGESPFCVVGIGASAGGLEAIQELLSKLPDNTGMAFVVIQHLSPDYKSMLSEILCKYTMMPVMQAENGQTLERNTVYLIPPKFNMEVKKGKLILHAFVHTRVINHPIDIFFRSLANEYETHAVAAVLSGTGSDGSNGIRAVKEQGGVILVQRPETAKFDGMPRSALQTGFADMVLSPADIAEELTHIAESMSSEPSGMTNEELLNKIYSILKRVSNVNYTYYKQTTVTRRIERRMVVNHIESLYEYVNFLLSNNDEAAVLAKDVLIGVTNFFRDSECFDALKERVVKPLIQKHENGPAIRAWVAGCSTGEEAYSIAMLFLEAEDELDMHPPVKIFATDLDKDAVIAAGKGQYGENIIEDVSAQRLARFFTKKNSSYIVSRDLRRMVVFAPQNVFQDPPFGKLDLISCRNMMIYFQSNLQKDLFAIFHLALNNGGYLFLGRSEAVSGCGDIYTPLCPNEKIFVHNAAGHAPKDLNIRYHVPPIDGDIVPPPPHLEPPAQEDDGSGALRLEVLEKFLPPCLLIDEQNVIRHVFGDCNNYLRVPAGKGELNIFTMLADDLRIAVSTALKTARDENRRVAYDDVPVRGTRENAIVSLVVSPVSGRDDSSTAYFALLFLEQGRQAIPEGGEVYEVNEAASRRISDLESDLAQSQVKLKKTISELETVNEELQATNEELLTANEELQSSNEELQSVNEELYTVNAEYQEKLGEVTSLNNDISNFLASTMVGIIFLDDKLQIRRYTEYVSKEFSVMEQDVGRPIRFIAYNFVNIDLVDVCKRVAAQLLPEETEVISAAGKRYFMRVAPYRTSEKKIVGLVVTFVDLSEQKKTDLSTNSIRAELEQQQRENREKDSFLSRISHDVRTPLNAILGTAQLMETSGQADDFREQLSTIKTNVNYLLGIFNDILETSRISSGHMAIRVLPTREESFLESIATLVLSDAEQRGITLTTSLPKPARRTLLMDADHVSRVLVNLIGNAIKYTPEGGKVDFIVACKKLKNGKVRHEYTIADNGIGMSEEFQKKMFVPFEQESEISRGHSLGQGLGLYIVKCLVDAMNGTITCTSTTGQGTAFVVTLDYDIYSGEMPAERESEQDAKETLSGKRVLICEDQAINAEIARNMLDHFGVQCEISSNGREGIEKFSISEQGYYDAILMDLRMPVMDGRDATQAIRSQNRPDAQEIPILIMTADVFTEDRNDLLRAGATDFVYKPVDMIHLRDTLLKCLRENKSRCSE